MPEPRALGAFTIALLLAGCTQHMADQPRLGPYAASAFFPDGAADRPPVAHTIAQDGPARRADRPPMTRALILRGQERYAIACAPCHGLAGDGAGVIPAHGYPKPPTYHQPRLREADDAHFYDVITHGYGVMYPYANRVASADRWAIVAYIRALQVSQGGAR